MLSHICSCGLSGIDGFSVCVETDISNGLPAFDIVGLPDAAVKEAKKHRLSFSRKAHCHKPCPCLQA